jgi:hypothetical protein
MTSDARGNPLHDATASKGMVYMGTIRCFTIVELYFKVDQHRSFVVHIEAHIINGRDGVLLSQRINSKIMEDGLLQAIHSALDEEAEESS